MIVSLHSTQSITASSTAPSRSRKNLYFTVCIANLLAVLVGISIGWVSPLLGILTNKKHIAKNPLGRVITVSGSAWLGSLLAMGAIFGSYIAGFLLVKIGRRPSLLISCAVPLFISFVMLATAKTFTTYCISRILSGFGVASVFTILPLYSQEIAEVSNRGLVTASIKTFETAGRLYAYCIGPFTGISTFCITSAILTLFVITLLLKFVPESPYYLISIGKKDLAKDILINLRLTAGKEINEELDLIEVILKESKQSKASFRDILKFKASRKAFIITLGLTIFQNCSGIIPILFYSQIIFNESGSTIPSEYCAMIVGAVQFLASFVAPNFVDKLGRRWMLFISACGMCISEFLLGLYFFFDENRANVNMFYWLTVTCLVAYMISYNLGFGPLVWTVMAEIFPENMKSAAITVTVSIWWTLAFLLSKFFPYVKAALGTSTCFWIFSGNCFLAAVFVSTYLIETKGKTALQIQDLLGK